MDGDTVMEDLKGRAAPAATSSDCLAFQLLAYNTCNQNAIIIPNKYGRQGPDLYKTRNSAVYIKRQRGCTPLKKVSES
jgi:hypothetical protein